VKGDLALLDEEQLVLVSVDVQWGPMPRAASNSTTLNRPRTTPAHLDRGTVVQEVQVVPDAGFDDLWITGLVRDGVHGRAP
jgi:hypothetical protein